MIKSLTKIIQIVEREFRHDNDYLFVFEKPIIKITYNYDKDNSRDYKAWLLLFLTIGIILFFLDEKLAAMIPFSCFLIFKINDLVLKKHHRKYALHIDVKKKEILISSSKNGYQKKRIKKEFISKFYSDIKKHSLYVNYSSSTFITSVFCELKTGETVLLIEAYDKNLAQLQKKDRDIKNLFENIFLQ